MGRAAPARIIKSETDDLTDGLGDKEKPMFVASKKGARALALGIAIMGAGTILGTPLGTHTVAEAARKPAAAAPHAGKAAKPPRAAKAAAAEVIAPEIIAPEVVAPEVIAPEVIAPEVAPAL